MTDETPLEEIMDVAINETDGDHVGIQDLLDHYGDRTYGPALLFLGLITIAPVISVIPGLPSIAGIAIFLISIQVLVGRKTLWLPSLITRRSLAKDSLRKAADKSRPVMRWVDGFIARRIGWATGRPIRYAAACVATALAIVFPPLELVPGRSTSRGRPSPCSASACSPATGW